MLTVGVLSGREHWSQILAGMLGSGGPGVTGWVNPRESPAQDTQQLIDRSDLIWIPEKLGAGMHEAIQVIRRSKHLSLGFPVADFMEEAPFLVKLAHEAHVQVQVGHRDWHHPAFRSSLPYVSQPQSIRMIDTVMPADRGESHRLVFKTILADLDLLLGLAGTTVRRVRPHAARLQNDETLEIEIRIELHNGSVMNLLIRKYGPATERQIEIVQSGGLIRIDMLHGTSRYEMTSGSGAGRTLTTRSLWPPADQAAASGDRGLPGDEEGARHCLNFIRALEKGRHSLSSLEGGFKALEIALQVEAGLGSF